jgi:DNA polymerase III alpha subunit
VVSGVHDADPATAALIRSGDTLGCFQIESPAVRSTLARLPIRNIDDVAAALAIVRPGPASGDAKRAFIRRANGEELPTPPHPALATLLDATHGLLLYEEDLVRSIAAMTGFPIEIADTLRADLIAADPATEASLERGFVVAATARGHHPADVGHVWRELRRFAAYSFNRAHALSYAQIAWRCAWLAAHYPAAFACGVLDHYGGQYPLRTIAAAFARRGVRLLAPHVEHSAESTQLEDDAVRIGLARSRG